MNVWHKLSITESASFFTTDLEQHEKGLSL